TGACDTLPGEGIGFQKYNTPGTKEIRLAYTIEGLGGPYSEGRVDPTDIEGKNINGFGDLTPIPNTEGYCVVSNFGGAGDAGAPSQTFEEIPAVPLADGGEEPAIPEVFIKYEIQDLKFLATVNAPGTVFTGTIKRTEDICTATFSAVGLWPQIGCDPTANAPDGYSLECDPQPNVDAGHILGSGINPTFAPKGKPITCGKAGFCELQMTVDEIAKL
ncbi:MAG: putative secreted protein, partial [Myxococcaceae bacterium]|nr:putative secreted protein [Myxococcaceae bacterium]